MVAKQMVELLLLLVDSEVGAVAGRPNGFLQLSLTRRLTG